MADRARQLQQEAAWYEKVAQNARELGLSADLISAAEATAARARQEYAEHVDLGGGQ